MPCPIFSAVTHVVFFTADASLEAKLAHKPPPPLPKPTPKKATIDPGLSAFMALEAKLKKKHEAEYDAAA